MDRIERVWLQAEQVFGDKEKAAVWLLLPRTAFGGCSALELAREEAGYQRVNGLLLARRSGCNALHRHFQSWQTSIVLKTFDLCAKVVDEVNCRFSEFRTQGNR